MHGCTSPKQCQTVLRFVGTAPADECSPPPEPVRIQRQSARKSKSHMIPLQIKVCTVIWHVCERMFNAALTLTKGKAGPGAKGSFSCSIWYLRYSSTPFCSNTFCSRSVRNKTREETAMVTAFSGLGCRKRRDRMENGMMERNRTAGSNDPLRL